jgi:hypothetical protein
LGKAHFLKLVSDLNRLARSAMLVDSSAMRYGARRRWGSAESAINQRLLWPDNPLAIGRARPIAIRRFQSWTM